MAPLALILLALAGAPPEDAVEPGLIFTGAQDVGPDSGRTPTLRLAAPSGGETRVWLTLHADRLHVAAEGDTERLELAIASVPASWPSLGWSAPDGPVELSGPADCAPLIVGPAEEIARCQAWVADAEMRLAALRDRFVRRVVIEGSGASVDGARRAEPVARSGDRLTLDLPSGVLPATTQAPLGSLRVLVRAGAGPARWAGAPTTLWPELRLEAPIAFGAQPEVVAAAIARVDPATTLAFYEPGPAVTAVHVAHPRWEISSGVVPSGPSPAIDDVPLGPVRTLGVIGGGRLVQVPIAVGERGEPLDGLGVRDARGRIALFEGGPVSGAPRAIVPRAGGAVDLVYAEDTINNPSGRGYCWACSAIDLQVVRASLRAAGGPSGQTVGRAERLLEERVGAPDGELSPRLAIGPGARRLVVRFAPEKSRESQDVSDVPPVVFVLDAGAASYRDDR